MPVFFLGTLVRIDDREDSSLIGPGGSHQEPRDEFKKQKL